MYFYSWLETQTKNNYYTPSFNGRLRHEAQKANDKFVLLVSLWFPHLTRQHFSVNV